MAVKMVLLFLLAIGCFINAVSAPGFRLPEIDSTELSLISKPTPNYTAAARRKGIEGWVRLRVTFQANGEIGEVTLLEESSKKKKKLTKSGLVEQAILAAKKIKFEPARKDGRPITVTKTVEYSFTIY